MSRYRSHGSDDNWLGCIQLALWLALVSVTLWIQGGMFEYVLNALFGKDVNWVIDIIGGALTSGFIVVVYFLVWLFGSIGVLHFPVF